MFASPVVILFTSNTPLSYESNSFKDLSAWVINRKDADTSALASEKCWLSNGLCFIFALLWEPRGFKWLLSFLCWVCVYMWRECLLQVSIFLTKQRQYIFHMLIVVTYHDVHYKLSSGWTKTLHQVSGAFMLLLYSCHNCSNQTTL